MNTWRNASLAAMAAALSALTTACGQDKGTGTPNGQNVSNATPAGQAGNRYGSESGYGSGYGYGYGSDSGAENSTAKEAGRLAVQDGGKLGEVLTDGKGFTLHRFDKDTASPPKSNCEGDCVKAWLVAPAANATASAGVGAALLGKVTRADGTEQLTVPGRPMCRYTKDTAPGAAEGEGAGGTWYASAPDGKKAAVNADGPAGAATAVPPGLSVREDPELGKTVVDSGG